MTAVDRLVANGNSIINFLKDFSSNTEKDASISWIKDDDTQETHSFSNVKKYQREVGESSKNGFKNILINGDFRVNQRGAGSKTETANAYNYDRWYFDGTNLIQKIEELNYIPNTIYTLSGENIETTQLTSPSSGVWEIAVSTNANRVQLEEGVVATPFEHRPYGLELSLCQRYYETTRRTEGAQWDNVIGGICSSVSDGSRVLASIRFKVKKRAIPTVKISDPYGEANQMLHSGTIFFSVYPSMIGADGFMISTNDANAEASKKCLGHYLADAEL
jgi:hypothetical protein